MNCLTDIRSALINKESRYILVRIDGKFIRQVNFDWDKLSKRYSYVKDIDCLANTKQLVFNKDVTFFIGKNGSGKSTLIKAIASKYGFPAEGGTLNFMFSSSVSDSDSESGHYDFDDQNDLEDIISLVRGYKRAHTSCSYYFRAESFYNVATAMRTFRDRTGLKLQYGGRDMHEQSHGQSYDAFMKHFEKPGLFILDEPESALSPYAQLSLLQHINELRKKGAQFIIATHSPILLALPDVDIISFDGYELKRVFYEDTDIYKIYLRIAFDRENLVKEFLSDIKKEPKKNLYDE